jgi:hypothetical protein
MDGTNWGSYPVAGFDISGVEPLGCVTRLDISSYCAYSLDIRPLTRHS